MATRNNSFSEPEIDCRSVPPRARLVILSANLDGSRLCERLRRRFCLRHRKSFTALGLAALHAAQTYAFDHARFSSSLQQILVSFWPVILILAGVLLLRDVFRASFLGRGGDVSPAAAGNANE